MSLLLTSYMGTQAQAVGLGRHVRRPPLARRPAGDPARSPRSSSSTGRCRGRGRRPRRWERFSLGGVGFTVIDVALVYFVVAGQITAIGRARSAYSGPAAGPGGGVPPPPGGRGRDGPAAPKVVLDRQGEAARRSSAWVPRPVLRRRGRRIPLAEAEAVGSQRRALGRRVPATLVVAGDVLDLVAGDRFVEVRGAPVGVDDRLGVGAHPVEERGEGEPPGVGEVLAALRASGASCGCTAGTPRAGSDRSAEARREVGAGTRRSTSSRKPASRLSSSGPKVLRRGRSAG